MVRNCIPVLPLSLHLNSANLIFQLSDEYVFPPAHLAEEDGLIAVGGDLSPGRLLLAYSTGIFPWYSEGEPILWHSPDPRFVLFPDELHLSKSMRQWMRKANYKVTYNTAFEEVIQQCSAVPRKDQDGTWIVSEMIDAYILLHELGYAISTEVWNEAGELVGGLYGVRIGHFFAGESMFSKEANCSKLALIETVQSNQFALVDCQVYTDHLASLGAKMISREAYLGLLSDALDD